jgi:DNA-binding CsgD family transcriptional regulator
VLRSHAVFERFYGRHEELALLLEALRVARFDERGSSIIVAGDSGVGKTRLLAEFGQAATEQRCTVLTGAALEYIHSPYAPILEALASDGRAPPDVLSVLTAPAADGRVDPDADRLRRFTIIENHLRRRAVGGAVVLIVEDLHWSDASTPDLLRHLTRRLRDAADVEADIPRAGAVVRLEREGASRVAVGPLPRSAIVAAIAATIPGDVSIPENEIDAICDLAEGRPFVAEELLRDAIARARRAESVEGSIVISLRTSVLERLAKFETGEREEMLCAAVIGREFDVSLLAEVVDRPLAAVQRTLRRARDAQLVVDNPRTARMAFRHAITREVLYRELLLGEAIQLHSRIADVLEAGDLQTRADEIAYHWWAARSPRAVAWNERAAERASAIHAYADAAVFYERALDLAPREGAEYPRILQSVAFALTTSGEVERARARSEEAVRALRGRGMFEEARRQMLFVARQYYETGDVENAIRCVQLIREELRDVTPGPAHFAAETTLGAMLAMQGREQESLQILDAAEALEVDKEAIDLCRAANARGLAFEALDRYDESIAAYERALHLAEGFGRADLVAHMHGNVGSTALNLGRMEQALTSLEQAVSAAKAGGHTRALALLNIELARAVLRLGEIARCRRICQEVLSTRHVSIKGELLVQAVDLRLRTLQLDSDLPGPGELSQLLMRAFGHGEMHSIVEVGAAVAAAYLTSGDRDSAARTIADVLARLPTPAFGYLAFDLAASIGSADDVAIARDLLIRTEARGRNEAARAHRLLFEARCAARRGDEAESRATAMSAAEAFRALPWPVEEAESLEVAGDPSGALAIFRRVGATRQVRRLEDALGVRRSQETRGPEGLSRREQQVAELLVRGDSYREIGDALGIGERTVETHAKSVYRKVGVKSRFDLATLLRARAG